MISLQRLRRNALNGTLKIESVDKFIDMATYEFADKKIHLKYEKSEAQKKMSGRLHQQIR